MTTEISTPLACETCGHIMAPDAPEGLCPACLLRNSLVEMGDDPGEMASPAGAFEPPSVEELAPLFPQFELLEQIGRGGMGAVYRARHKKLDRQVALKILPPELGADPAFEERFAREGRTMARLHHPGIVGIHDFGEAGELYYLVLEYVDGRNLGEVVEEEGPLGIKRSIDLAQQICAALAYAHARGVVHRDVKPENILVDGEGRIRMADFGLAKLLDAGGASLAPSLTSIRQALGTPHYMAPEQLESPLEVDHRADIYSLGVVLYQMTTGKLPLGRFPAPHEERSMPRKLSALIMRCLEREPGDRFDIVSDLRVRLRDVRRQRVLAVTSDRDKKKSLALEVSVERKRHRRIVLAGLVAALASFLDWAIILVRDESVRPVREVFGFVDAWHSHFWLPLVRVPCWFVPLGAALLGIAAMLRLQEKIDCTWKLFLSWSIVGMMGCLAGVITQAFSNQMPGPGLLLVFATHLVIAVTALQLSPLRSLLGSTVGARHKGTILVRTTPAGAVANSRRRMKMKEKKKASDG